MGEFEMKRRNDEKGITITIYELLSDKMLSWEQSFLFTLLHTTPAYAENKWKLVLYDFSWHTRSVT